MSKLPVLVEAAGKVKTRQAQATAATAIANLLAAIAFGSAIANLTT
jgi:hypothetical protein